MDRARTPPPCGKFPHNLFFFFLKASLSDIHADAVKLAEENDEEDEKAGEERDKESKDANIDDKSEKEEEKKNEKDDEAKESKDDDKSVKEEELTGDDIIEDSKDESEDDDKDTESEVDEPTSRGQRWFKAIKPDVLDAVIAEMNGMNRWFAKVNFICF